VTQLNDLEYTTRSGFYWTQFDGNLTFNTPHHWKKTLAKEDVETIEYICHHEMVELGYSTHKKTNI